MVEIPQQNLLLSNTKYLVGNDKQFRLFMALMGGGDCEVIDANELMIIIRPTNNEEYTQIFVYILFSNTLVIGIRQVISFRIMLIRR